MRRFFATVVFIAVVVGNAVLESKPFERFIVALVCALLALGQILILRRKPHSQIKTGEKFIFTSDGEMRVRNRA
jgi:hypothetical protein